MTQLPIDAHTSIGDAVTAVTAWAEANLPASWQVACRQGPAALRAARSPQQYRQWYPVFAHSGLVAPNWPTEYGGLALDADVARAVEAVLAPFHLYRLNPLGLNNAAAALLSHGTEQQRRRFLPPIVRNEEHWCSLFSEPGAGSDLASLATRAVWSGGDWVVTGQKVWTTAADTAHFGLLLARTDPNVPKHEGITFFILNMRQPGVLVRPLRQASGESEFNEVFLDGARVPDAHRVGDVGAGWAVSATTLASERQMVSGAGSGGIGRLGGSSAERLIEVARESGCWTDTVVRHQVMTLWAEERVRAWTNARVRSALAAGQSPGAASSIGKIHQASLNQQIQDLMVDLIGTPALAWPATHDADAVPREVHGMLRSLANGTEGGTTEINKNILAERVLGLPKEPDPWRGKPWKDVPRS